MQEEVTKTKHIMQNKHTEYNTNFLQDLMMKKIIQKKFTWKNYPPTIRILLGNTTIE